MPAFRSFFDSVSQEWLVWTLEHRIGDARIIRLIRKWLKAGVLEDGVVTVSETGMGQPVSILIGRGLPSSKATLIISRCYLELARHDGIGMVPTSRAQAASGRCVVQCAKKYPDYASSSAMRSRFPSACEIGMIQVRHGPKACLSPVFG